MEIPTKGLEIHEKSKRKTLNCEGCQVWSPIWGFTLKFPTEGQTLCIEEIASLGRQVGGAHCNSSRGASLDRRITLDMVADVGIHKESPAKEQITLNCEVCQFRSPIWGL